jgi:hypothetical protein
LFTFFFFFQHELEEAEAGRQPKVLESQTLGLCVRWTYMSACIQSATDGGKGRIFWGFVLFPVVVVVVVGSWLVVRDQLVGHGLSPFRLDYIHTWSFKRLFIV